MLQQSIFCEMELAKRVFTRGEPYTFRGKPLDHRPVEIGRLQKRGYTLRIGYQFHFHIFLAQVCYKILYIVQNEVHSALRTFIKVK